MRKPILGVMLALCLAGAAELHAQSIAIVNPGFEADFAPDGGFPVLEPVGWSRFDPFGIVNQNSNAVGVLNPAGTTFFAGPVPEGRNVALVYLEQRARGTAAGNEVGLVQTLTGSTLQPDTLYTLKVAVGNIASGTGLGAYAGFGFTNLSAFPGYRVELLAGGQSIGADNNSLLIPEGEFAVATVLVDSRSAAARYGQTLGIRLVNLNAFGTAAERGREVDFDAVSLVASAVPEPAPWMLLLAGVALFAGIGRRRV